MSRNNCSINIYKMAEPKIPKFLSLWNNDPGIAENFSAVFHESPAPGKYVDIPVCLHPDIKTMLTDAGISQLYTHQGQAIEKILQRQNVVITTSTASGKSLCYQAPILDIYLRTPNATSLMIFPTKALAQDQLLQINSFIHQLENLGKDTPKASIFDGDTPTTARKLIRDQVNVLMTNPDMLHIGILPHHTRWARFFKGLSIIVLDEIHTYRGVFGSHISNLIRRLNRIARFYGSDPVFVLTSATIANPGEHASALIDSHAEVIDEDGSPRGQRSFIIYNPPIVNKSLGIRKSASTESVRLAEDMLHFDIQAILFARSRKAVEFLLSSLHQRNPTKKDRISGYRSGYLPGLRRQIENGLKTGAIQTVVATNALELGVDIGRVDAIILSGYPGSIAAVKQQAGRSGRRGEDSLAVMVASSSPIDQFLARSPDYFIRKSPENALISPENLLILLQHMRCAAFELPFFENEVFGSLTLETTRELLQFLSEEQVVHHANGRYFWVADQYPSESISLRSASSNRVLIEINQKGRRNIIGEVDQESAKWMVHPGALYFHNGEQYIVEELDLDNGCARAHVDNPDYYTEPRFETSIQIIQTRWEDAIPGSIKKFGELFVITKVKGYRKILWDSMEVLDDIPLDLSPTTLRTNGMWIEVPEATVENLRSEGAWTNDANIYGSRWPQIRELVRRRDHFICQICGSPEKQKEHHVHHIQPFRSFSSPEAANVLSNLVTLCPNCHARAETVVRMKSGLSGLCYALMNLAPLFLMCDPRDLGATSEPASDITGGLPAIIFYDLTPGGIGLCEDFYRRLESVLVECRKLIETCECDDGCPSCVGPGGENGAGSKREALALLNYLC